VLAVTAGLLPRETRAEAPLKESSLSFVADDVAFYSMSLRLKEQFDALVSSKAYAKFKEIKSVKEGLEQLEAMRRMPGGPLEQLNNFIEAPEYADVRKLLADMVSNEIFIYGDSSYGDLVALFGAINSANRLGAIGGGGDPLAQPRALLRALNENREQLQVPGTLIGFRLKDTELGKQQLKNLGGLLTLILDRNQQLADRFETRQIDGADFLTLRLDGEMVPWEQIPIGQLEENPGEFDDLIAKARTLQLAISLGVRDDYLLIGFGKDFDVVSKSSGAKLFDRKEFAPLHKYEDKRICGVGYVSEDFAKKAGQIEGQLDDAVEMVEMLLPATPFDEDVQKELGEDIRKLRDDLKPYLPKPGAQMGFAFLNGRGYEGYQYNWSENKLLDGSKKLTLVDHVGGDPILFYAARAKYDPEQFNLVIRVLKRGYYYLNKYAEAKLPEEQKDKFEKYRDTALPYLEKLEKITTEKLVPSFKDGQGAFVLDAKVTSQRWVMQMPPSKTPLPMLELAAVYGVSDAALLRSAMSEYFTVVQELLDALHEADPNEVQEVKIPEVTTDKTDSGTVSYFAELSTMLPIDPQIKPNAGLSEDIAVLSITPDQTKRLLASTPPTPKDGPLGEVDQPLASAARLNWPALVDAVVPWIEYALTLHADTAEKAEAAPESDDANEKDDGSDDEKAEADNDDDSKDGKDEDDDVEEILEQVREGAEILKCFRGYSSVSRVEDNAVVTHHESVFEDLKE
jgi:hypothetical protein